MFKWTKFAISTGGAVAIAAVAMITPTPARAAVIDPNFTACQGTTSGSCGADPNLFSGTSGTFNAFVIGKGGQNLGSGPLNPFLILVAVPSLPTPPLAATAPTFTNTPSVAVTVATSAQYLQSNAPNSSGYLGELDGSVPSNCQDIYCFAGLNDGNSSESFNNFTNYYNFLNGLNTTLYPNANPLGSGIVPTSYSVYEFVATVNGVTGGTPLGTNGLYTVGYSDIPLGSFVSVYGIDSCNQSTTAKNGTYTPCSDAQFVYDSAFTVSGFVNDGGKLPPSTIPEPGTLALLGVSLTALAFCRRRRIPKS